MDFSFGTITLENGKVIHHLAPPLSFSIRVANMAQGVRESVEPFFNQPVSVQWTLIHESDGTPFAMVHKIVLHRDIARRAYELFQAQEGRTAEEDWLRAEQELLDFIARS